jgi:hydroxyacylglutathione hydrolase
VKKWEAKNGCQITRLLGGRSNVFLVTNGKVNLVVDTSIGLMRRRLLKNLHRAGIDRIDFLLLTHAHFDHAANAALLKKLFNPQAILHQSEAGLLKRGENATIGGTNFYSRIITTKAGFRVFKRLRYEPCGVDLAVDREFDLSGFGLDAFIFHTPGHTKGSVSLVVGNEIAIVGDALFGVFKSTVLPPFAEDTAEMVRSWGKLLETGCRLFLPSHGGEKTREELEVEYKKRCSL